MQQFLTMLFFEKMFGYMRNSCCKTALIQLITFTAELMRRGRHTHTHTSETPSASNTFPAR